MRRQECRSECRNLNALKALYCDFLQQGLSQNALVLASQNAHHGRFTAACNNAALLSSLYQVYRHKLSYFTFEST